MEGKVQISDGMGDNIVALCRFVFWQKAEV